VWLTPVVALHASSVHASPSSTVSGVPDVHVPELQVSWPSHTVELSHAVPLETGVLLTPVTALQASVVHGLPSFTVIGVPATQTPEALQVS
jgi:hypothetical protein